MEVHLMRKVTGVILLLAMAAPVWAEGEDQLQRMYDNALAQLRAAQERRNELAKENEKLTASVADLEKRLAEAKTDLASMTEKSFRLRAEYGAFQDFLRRYPAIDARWRSYMRQDMHASDNVLDQLNSDWPFSVEK